jgi:thiamine-phosphate pyrophosphorylase
VLLYYITDRTQLIGDESSRRRRLLDKIAEAARAGVDFIQLREKDLPARDLEALARAVIAVIRQNSPGETRLLINSRSDIAIACGADGVHLQAKDVTPGEVRRAWNHTGNPPLVAVSCHSSAEIARAASEHASFAVFGPIFEKRNHPDARLEDFTALEKACVHRLPVLALGGVTLENAQSCIRAGASGVAAIRLFQDHAIAEVVSRLRG